MIRPNVSATDGSIAIGGDNNAPVFNVGAGAVINLKAEQQILRELPSVLGEVIGLFSMDSADAVGARDIGQVPPEVVDKLSHNDFPANNRLIVEWRKYALMLERAYRGAEQQNIDARYLVLRRAGTVYTEQLYEDCREEKILFKNRLPYVRDHAEELVASVIKKLFEEYIEQRNIVVHQEVAHLAISLIVADAIIECEVLERN
jgi:hypothetical protein